MKLITLTYVLISLSATAQNRNNIWCFGDSAGINFSSASNPTPIHTAVKSRGSCVSISDSNSNLLFYAYTRATIAGNTTLVKNKNDSIMPNGSNVVGSGWYQELIIIPFPDDTLKYYLFSAGVTNLDGFYYSVIDMSLDSGRGAVWQKNIQLLSNAANDGLTAVKHGNGRDWWVIHREFQGTNNTFYKFLITPTGISTPDTQNIGSLTSTNTCTYNFNKTGDKLAMVMYGGLIETFDFNRCTGLLSNHVLIRPKNTSPPAPRLWSCAFSPNDRFLYVSSHPEANYIFQIDLQDSTPWANVDTLWTDSAIQYSAGALKLAPDNKIYFATNWYDGINFPYPYPDTAFNIYNTNLGVITSPDSFGANCNFQPYSFYLGGNRAYWGLPNNPDYDLHPLYGSICDSLSTGIHNFPTPQGEEMFVTYISSWEKLFVNAQHLKGKTYTLTVTDITGRFLFVETGRLQPPYFTKDLDCNGFAKGMYIVTLSTDKELLSKKFIRY